ERMLKVQGDSDAEDTFRLLARDQQGIEHSLAMPPVMSQAAEEQCRPLPPRGDVEDLGRLGTVGGRRLEAQQRRTAERRIRIRPGPPAGEEAFPGRAAVDGCEPVIVDRREPDLQLEDRPAAPEAVSLLESGERTIPG